MTDIVLSAELECHEEELEDHQYLYIPIFYIIIYYINILH